jgi:hypothetical protein
MAIRTIPAPTSRPGTRARVAPATIAGLFALAIGVVPVVVMAEGLIHNDSLSARISLAVTAMAAVGVGCLLLVRQRVANLGGPTWARIGPFYVVYFTLAFGVASLAWLRPQGPSRRIVEPSMIPAAILLSLLALVCWTVGYCFGPPALAVRALSRVLATDRPPGAWRLRFAGVPILLYAIATLARLIRLAGGRFGYLQDPTLALNSPSSLNQLLALTEDFALYGLVLAALDAAYLSRSLRSRVVLAVLAIAEIAVGLFAASKETVLFTFVAIALVWTFSRGRIPRAALAVAALAVLVVFPYNTSYRNNIRDPGTRSTITVGGAALAAPSTLSATIGQLTPRTLVVKSPAQIAARVRQVDNVAIIHQRTPEEVPYRPWEELFTGPVTGLVPRALWPSKPLVSSGYDFSVTYYNVPKEAVSASAVTVPGDFLRHGGIPPLVLGMAFIGVLVRLVDKSCDPTRDRRCLVAFVPLFTLLIKSESDFVELGLHLIQSVVILAFLSRFVFVSRPSSSTDGAA